AASTSTGCWSATRPGRPASSASCRARRRSGRPGRTPTSRCAGRSRTSTSGWRRSRASRPPTAGATRSARSCASCSRRSRRAAGDSDRHYLYEFPLSADLMSLAARLQTAEERGELDDLDFDPELLEERAKLIERGRNRENDLQRWFFRLASEYGGRKVSIGGN